MGYFKKPVIGSDGNVYCEDCISTWSKNNAKGPTGEKQVNTWTECKLFNKYYLCGSIRTDMNLIRLTDTSISNVSLNNVNDALRIISMIDSENSQRLREDVSNISLITEIFSNQKLIKKLNAYIDKTWSGIDGWNLLHYIIRFGSADLINYVLDQGGYDLNAETNDGWQLIHFVSSNSNMLDSKNNLIIFKFLVNCGVELENVIDDDYRHTKLIHFVTSDMNNFSSSDQLSAIKILLDQCIDVNVADKDGWKPIHYMCSEQNNLDSNDQLSAIKMLSELDIDLDPMNNLLITPINYLMGNNNFNHVDKMEAFKILTSNRKINFNNVDVNGNGIAHFVFNPSRQNDRENEIYNRLKFVEILIKHGVDFDKPDNNGFRPIHLLANVGKRLSIIESQCQIMLIKMLIKQGVDMESSDGSGNKPIHLFCNANNGLRSYDQLEIIKLFIEKKYDFTLQNSNGHQPVNLICGKYINLKSADQLSAIELLIQNNINMNIKDSKQWAAAQYICSNSNKLSSSDQLKAIKMLTMYDVDFNAPDDKGWRPIHDICSTGNNLTDNDRYEAIKLLINYGVDLDVATHSGLRPIHQITGGGGKINDDQCLELLKMMIDKGVDLDVKHNDGKTPLQIITLTTSRYSLTTISKMQLLLTHKKK